MADLSLRDHFAKHIADAPAAIRAGRAGAADIFSGRVLSAEMALVGEPLHRTVRPNLNLNIK